jgi:hypothetical protein
MTLVIERRASTRHATAADETYVQIMDWTGKRLMRARLLDISTGGALILTDSFVATSQKLRVRLESAPETGWIDAEAVHFGRPQVVGIRFSSPCRPELVLEARRGGNPHLVNPSGEEMPYIGQVRAIEWAPAAEPS